MPKVGGLAMAVGVLVPMLLMAFGDSKVAAILLGGGVIVLFGFIDDVKDLGYRTKFGAQLVAAVIIVVLGQIKISSLGDLLPAEMVMPDWLSIPLTIIVIVGVTNAINFSDGLDGLAGGTMLLCFLCLAFLAYRTENTTIALLSVAAGGGIFGFLRYNTYPATVFMGDAGSQLLGFMAITMALTLSQGSTPISPLFPLLLLGLPLLDTVMVMGERIAGGRSPFLADKNHLHHKLLNINFYHSEAVFIVYLLQAAMVTASYAMRFYSERSLLLVYLALAASIICLFEVAQKHGWYLNRPGLIDRVVKQQLKIHIKDRFLVVKVSQAIVESGFLVLLIITCLLPPTLPEVMSIIAGILVATIALVCIFKPSLKNHVLRLAIYFFLPLVVYYSELNRGAWVTPKMMLAYNLCFGALVFFAVTTLKATRRKQGFHAAPIDFLMMFIALVVPNLPELPLYGLNLGFMAAKIIVFYYVFEVLVGELRGNQNRLNLAVVIGMTILAVKLIS
jgi:UDP-GlcNAc:undecaprenyl-phosphate GlcNAc-1-phosphate transferase